MRLYDKGWERGSSPHARGTCPSASACCLPHRFIPACAGNAMTRVKLLLTVAVHPRMRGERSSSSATRSRAGGSSPHARGTHWNGGKDSAPRRFIPACAGNAPGHPGPVPGVPVHPRMRGERTGAARLNVIAGGSSPHARGTRWSRLTNRPNPRFIPACAGNAFSAEIVHRLRPVHPRMRGERMKRPSAYHSRTGSSPHARGTPDVRWSGRGRFRFIPACAGNAGCSSMRPCC